MFSNLSGKYQHMCCRYVETNKKWVNDLILKIFSRGVSKGVNILAEEPWFTPGDYFTPRDRVHP
jgi:hypothetical protein